MGKKIILVSLFFLTCFIANAQRRQPSNDLTYKIADNAPEDANNLSIYFMPVYVELFKPNSSYNLGFGAGFNYRLPNDNLFIEGHFKNAYLDRLDENSNQSILSGKTQHGTTATMSMGGVLTYNFINEEIDKNYDVTVKSSGNVRYYTLIPGKVKAMTGVRLGADYYKGEYKFDRGINGTIIDKDTLANNTYSNNGQEFFTMVKTITTSIGISRTIIYDMQAFLNFKGKENIERNLHYASTFYFDLVFAPSISFDNIYVPMNFDGSGGGYGWYNYHLVDISSMKKQPFGFRLGWQQFVTKKFGTTLGAEFGSRPGLAGSSLSDNLYLTLKFAISVSAPLGK